MCRGSQTWRPTKRTLTYVSHFAWFNLYPWGKGCFLFLECLSGTYAQTRLLEVGGKFGCPFTSSFEESPLRPFPFVPDSLPQESGHPTFALADSCPNPTFLPFGVLVGPCLVAAPKVLSLFGEHRLSPRLHEPCRARGKPCLLLRQKRLEQAVEAATFRGVSKVSPYSQRWRFWVPKTSFPQ